MPPELTPILLAEPAPQATRVLASERLAQVKAAYDQFLAGEETGLHDLRVALRRLRSWLRAYRPEVDDTLRGRTRRRLNRLAQATNAARDAEVALAWIVEQGDLSARERVGVKYIVERLERERDEALSSVRATLESDLPRLVKALSQQLETFWLRRSVTEPAPVAGMAAATREVLLEHTQKLGRAISRIESPSDFEGVHRTRIAAKRLRYVLETLNGDPAASMLVKRLTGLQDVLGLAHDSHRIANRMVRELGECAARDARRTAMLMMNLDGDGVDEPPFAKVRPGLTELARRAHESDRKAYDSFRRSWRKRQIESTLAAVEMVADSLSGGSPEIADR